ncbi:MAG: hypothetical protein H6811_01360 [Phycisphaeraceae bacterium]|nr:hypothetical protein [Phycisphaeraceae bacterium]
MTEPKQTPARLALRWTLTLGALFVMGPVAGMAVHAMKAPDGTHNASPLASGSPGAGVLALALVAGLTALVGAASGRFFGPRIGLRNAGFVAAWAAWSSGEVHEILRSARSGGPMSGIAIEAAVVAVLLIAATVATLLASRAPAETAETRELPVGPDGLTRALRSMGSVAALAGLVGALGLGYALAWLVALESLKGQAVFAAIFAGIGAGVGARLGAALADSGHQPAPLLPVLAIALLAIAGSILPLATLSGPDAILSHALAGTLHPLSRVMPLDWMAGGLLGVPIGLGWAGAMMDSQSHAEAAKAESAGVPATNRS